MIDSHRAGAVSRAGTAALPPTPPTRTTSPHTPPEPLGAVTRLLAAFDAAGVRYCQWKSNEHVAEGLAGDTDLDLLVDRAQHGAATTVLLRQGFKRFDATPGMGYPAVEDHLVLDPETGRLGHLHVHYRLVLGEKHLKGYRLPWEARYLETRRWDPAARTFVADPGLELLTLAVRCATKVRARDAAALRSTRPALRGGVAREWEWLLARADRVRCVALCGELLGEPAVAPFEALLAGPVTHAALRRFRRAARARLASCRVYGAVSARGLRWARELAWLAAGAARRSLRVPLPLRRTVPSGGIIVALVGCDGSGKSTMLADASRTLAAKIDVLRLYFGSGDGPTSALRWPLVALKAVAGRTRRARPAADDGRTRPLARTPRGGLPALVRILWALTLAAEKRRRLRAAWRARNRGMLVLTDRFPQRQFTGFNDGPLLAHYADDPRAPLRALARWEAVPYEWAAAQPPDVVVKLHVLPEVALRRKPETGRAEVTRRVDAIERLTYGPATVVVDVDANLPRALVAREVRRAIWAYL